MPTPRIQRALSGERRFVDRVEALAAFRSELAAVGDRPRVLNYSGVGGIGKSRLLRELRGDLAQGPSRTALLDLQVPALRQHEDALPVLRRAFGQQGVRFDRFDIAFAVLWQRFHPNQKLSSASLPFVEESELLSGVLDLAGVPVIGTGIALVKLADRTRSGARRRRATKGEELLQRLDDLDNSQVLDATTFLFCDDLREASSIRPYVVFVDAYEALVTGRALDADTWLRDLVAQLDRGLVVVASREPLHWDRHDLEWSDLVRSFPMPGLPQEARVELLVDGGITDDDVQRAVARASDGLPFYLNLALDTGRHTDGADLASVSSEEILQRFMHHVDPTVVRILELLSAARVFDYDLFKELTAAFDLPGDRLRWESLTSYSFVSPAGPLGFRLHQLMATALRDRLSASVSTDAHRFLHAIWRGRAMDGAPHQRGRALCEVVYHGIRSASVDADEVLRLADQALALGGRQALDGIYGDLRQHLIERPDADLALVARCLETESAIVMGDAVSASRIATSGSKPAVTSAAGARLSIAYAHSLRLTGETAKAGSYYDLVWREHLGPARHSAALWVADIHMWQGRFRTAFDLGRSVLDSPDLTDLSLRADIMRLLHLGHRFHLDFHEAATSLDEATALYREADSVIGTANVATNQAELLAWTDPEAALVAGAVALEAQQELSALHELGKTYTALGLALLQLDRDVEASDAFDQSCHFLERAQYRSGRARAELFRSFLHARRGRLDDAANSIEWAVSELTQSAVYPTLISAASMTLMRLGRPSAAVSEAAVRARESLEPLCSLHEFDERTLDLVDRLLGVRA
jgi:tetratricopeptide (TPR) repeat protein